MGTINGTSGNDFVHAAGDGLVPPGGYNDIPEATDTYDYYYGELGGNDRVYLGAGNDYFYFDGGFTAGDRLDGGADSDYLYLYRPTSIVFASATIRNIEVINLENYTTGQFSLTFHDGNVAAGRSFNIDASALETTSPLLADFSAETDASYIYIAGGSGNDTLIGGSSSNSFQGYAGDDFLVGGSAGDNLNGGAGNDTLVGGLGDDSYSNVTSNDVIVEDAAGGTADSISSYESITLAANVERLSLNGIASTTGTGNDLDNWLYGNEGDNRLLGAGGNDYAFGSYGNDSLAGGSGNDTLYGGTGNDTLVGGGGTDYLSGDSGNDTYVDPQGDNFYEYVGRGIDTVESSTTFSLESYANIENLTLTGTGATDGTGSSIDNTLNGNSGANRLSGLAGNDRLNGNDGVNSLLGGDGYDTLSGGSGKDVLIGGPNNDTMNGGADADTFRFAATNAGTDRINGFNTAEDRFDLAGGTFSNRTEAGGNTTLTHAGGTIVIDGVTGLSLGAWNLLVLPAGGTASAGGAIGAREAGPALAAADPAPAMHAAWLAAALQNEIVHLGGGDWVFA